MNKRFRSGLGLRVPRLGGSRSGGAAPEKEVQSIEGRVRVLQRVEGRPEEGARQDLVLRMHGVVGAKLQDYSQHVLRGWACAGWRRVLSTPSTLLSSFMPAVNSNACIGRDDTMQHCRSCQELSGFMCRLMCPTRPIPYIYALCAPCAPCTHVDSMPHITRLPRIP